MSTLEKYINQMPAKRYYLAAQRLNVTLNDLLDDGITLIICAANEKIGSQTRQLRQLRFSPR